MKMSIVAVMMMPSGWWMVTVEGQGCVSGEWCRVAVLCVPAMPSWGQEGQTGTSCCQVVFMGSSVPAHQFPTLRYLTNMWKSTKFMDETKVISFLISPFSSFNHLTLYVVDTWDEMLGREPLQFWRSLLPCIAFRDPISPMYWILQSWPWHSPNTPLGWRESQECLLSHHNTEMANTVHREMFKGHSSNKIRHLTNGRFFE